MFSVQCIGVAQLLTKAVIYENNEHPHGHTHTPLPITPLCSITLEKKGAENDKPISDEKGSRKGRATAGRHERRGSHWRRDKCDFASSEKWPRTSQKTEGSNNNAVKQVNKVVPELSVRKK